MPRTQMLSSKFYHSASVEMMGNKRWQFKKLSPRFESFSRILPGDERIHECGLVDEPVSVPEDSSVRTIYDLLLRGFRLSSNGPCLGEINSSGDYEWLNYGSIIENAKFVGSALIKLGIEAGQNSRVAIAGLHSPNYITVGHALCCYSMVFVPLYYNYKFEDLLKIVDKCRIEVLFCDNYARAMEYIQRIDELPTLKNIILLKSEDKIPNGLIEGSKIGLYDWNYIIKMGKNNIQTVKPPKPTDIYIICHTSGTTGTPKGAMISHRALIATMTGPIIQWCGNKGLKVDHREVYLSFLSPAHTYEQIMQAFVLYHGGRIGVFSGNISRFLKDLQSLKPTIVAFVPRLLTKFEAQIKANLRQKNILIRTLFDFAIKSKTKDLKNGIINYSTIWDKTLFKSIHKLIGGRVHLIVTGGASIAPHVKEFSRIVYGCIIMEGYGQTETAAAVSLTLIDDATDGHIGIPSPWAQIKLISVPELGYDANNNEGEICMRGIGIMDGYFEEPELTRSVLDENGWLKSGDIGRWRNDGMLELIDRKGNFFKLSQGDFVSPERIEKIYQMCPLVSQIFVTGRQTESYLVAIIVPVVEKLEEIEIIGANSSRENIVLNCLREHGKINGLNELEQIRQLYIEFEEFTTDNNLLTPTLKMKRNVLLQKYQKIIDEMYKVSL